MNQIPVLIPFTFLTWALLIPILAMVRRRWVPAFTVLGAAVAAGFSVFGFLDQMAHGAIRYGFGGWQPPIGIEFVYDGLSSFMVLVINVVALIVLIHSLTVHGREFDGKQTAFYSLSMLMLLGFNGMVLTGDLFNLYVFLEISSLAAYALISVGDKPAPFAAFRYLIIGTVGGSLYLLGVGYLYTVTGTLNMIDMAAMLPTVAQQPAVVTALILITVGIGIKAAMFPMHGWLPDSYTYANTTSTALIAPIGTKVGAYVLMRVLLYVFGIDRVDAVIPLSTIIGILACAGILYGSIMAIAQSELKRMLAYSSVSQIGYILLGISLANPMGFVGAVLHVLNHAIMKAALFLVAGNLRAAEGHSDVTRFTREYHTKYRWTMTAFTIAAISMIGLPPLAGFFSKWYLALGTVQNGDWLFLVVILVSSLLNAVYFFRILEKVYMKDPHQSGVPKDDASQASGDMGAAMWAPAVTLALALILIGFANVWIADRILTFLPSGTTGF
jgi:multicomponent Na+:H+ antiporter subunit D